MKKRNVLMALLLCLALVLSSCAPKTEAPKADAPKAEAPKADEKKEEKKEEPKEDEFAFPTKVTHEGTPLPDGEGTLKIGLVYASPFKGLFSPVLYGGTDDSSIMAPTMWGTFMSDDEFKTRKGGPVDYIVDRDKKTVTLKIVKDYKWNDGTPVTAKDFAYAYEIIGHGDYTGPRYTNDYKNVVGIIDYNFGTMSPETLEKLKKSDKFKMPEDVKPAKEISGLKIIDEKTLEITFKEFGVNMLWNAGVPFEPVPYHQLKDIPVAKLQESDAIRVKPLSCGPYYMSNVVPGESVEFKANEHFWNGKAKIPSIVMTVIHPDKLVASMQAGEFDTYTSLPASKYQEIKELKNYSIVGRTQRSYSYLGFKLGKWDAAQKLNIVDPNAKMADLKLRQAMACSIDIQGLGESYYNSLSYRGNTIIPTPFTKYNNTDLKPIEFDVEKAKKLLDEAGFKDVDNDGFRENQKGEKLVIKVAHMQRDDITEKVASYYLQQWKSIGLNCEFTSGRLLEFNNFYDMVEADNPDIDVFFGGWSTGSNPNPYSLYGADAFWNFARYTDPELEAAMKKLSSQEAFDETFRVQAFKDMQKLFYEKMPVTITFYNYELKAINKRIKDFDFGYDDGKQPFWSYGDLQITAKEPIK